MSEKEKRILEIIGKTFPMMSEQEKDGFICFGEGMFYMASRRDSTQAPAQQAQAGA